MAGIFSLFPQTLLHHPSRTLILHSRPSTPLLKSSNSPISIALKAVKPKPLSTVFASSAEAAVASSDVAARRLYVGNIPRTVDSAELSRIVEEHGAVEKAEVMYDKYSGRSRRFAFVTMKTVDDANAAIEKLNGTQIGGRGIKVNVTEKPLLTVDTSLLQAEESQFIDSPHKVYVGNLAKTVTTEILTQFFSDKGKVLSAKVSRVPGTSKSSGFGFVSFSSEEDVEAAISSCNNAVAYQLKTSPFMEEFITGVIE